MPDIIRVSLAVLQTFVLDLCIVLYSSTILLELVSTVKVRRVGQGRGGPVMNATLGELVPSLCSLLGFQS